MVNAGNMVFSCYVVNKPEKPLKVFSDEESFKLYLSDVGILTSLSEINFSDIILNNAFMYKGSITKNYVAQELRCKDISLYYWVSKRDAEIDFMIYNKDGIIPIEVKSSENNTSKSLNYYIEKYKPSYSIRISSKNFGFENSIKSILLYATFCIVNDIKENSF